MPGKGGRGAKLPASPIPERVGRKAAVDLGLDMSSTCIGWAVGVDRELTAWGKFIFTKGAPIGEKLQAFDAWFDGLLELYQPTRVLCEKPLARRGNVTMRHNELFGVARLALRRRFQMEILDSWFISSITVKRVMNVRRGASHAENKQIMVDAINRLYGLGLRYHRSNKQISDDDAADAIAVLTTYWRLGMPRGQEVVLEASV